MKGRDGAGVRTMIIVFNFIYLSIYLGEVGVLEM